MPIVYLLFDAPCLHGVMGSGAEWGLRCFRELANSYPSSQVWEVGLGGRSGIGTTLGPAQQRPHIMGRRLKDPGIQPAPRLVIDRLPGRQIAEQLARGSPGAHDPVQPIKDLARLASPLHALQWLAY